MSKPFNKPKYSITTLLLFFYEKKKLNRLFGLNPCFCILILDFLTEYLTLINLLIKYSSQKYELALEVGTNFPLLWLDLVSNKFFNPQESFINIQLD